MTMPSLRSAIRRLRLKRRIRTARKAHACRFNHIEPCISDTFADKPEHRFPEKGWRLLARINCASPTAKPKDTYSFELDEDVLERIDFFACLFGSRKIE
jgi:hypothetical protein